ncbi:hypothetical protein TNCV_1579121 [Trichonephila clavipes]|nr:hypothetical protein TNCV_1579121 [Trichonephila clavipes]
MRFKRSFEMATRFCFGRPLKLSLLQVNADLSLPKILTEDFVANHFIPFPAVLRHARTLKPARVQQMSHTLFVFAVLDVDGRPAFLAFCKHFVPSKNLSLG